jgi:hypothetical protein
MHVFQMLLQLFAEPVFVQRKADRFGFIMKRRRLTQTVVNGVSVFSFFLLFKSHLFNGLTMQLQAPFHLLLMVVMGLP